MFGIVSYGNGVDIGPTGTISGNTHPLPGTNPGTKPERVPQQRSCGKDSYLCRVAEMRDFIDEVLQNAKFCSDFEAQDDEDDTYF